METIFSTRYLNDLQINVNPYTKEEALILRGVTKVLASIKMTPKQYSEMVQSKIYIHPQCSFEISTAINDFNIPLTETEKDFVTRVLSLDYNDRKDVENMAKILYEKTCSNEAVHHFNYIFAVDGCRADMNFSSYVDNLQIQLREDVERIFWTPFMQHVCVIRKIYSRVFDAEPLSIHEAIVKVCSMQDINDEDENSLARFYIKEMGTIYTLLEVQEIARPHLDKEEESRANIYST